MKLVSFNTNGLNQESKRKNVFNKLIKLNSILLLQETHSEKIKENKWKTECNSKIYFSHGLSNARGVCIVIPNILEHTVEEKITDSNGRILIIKIKIKNNSYVICNLYAPTQREKENQLLFIKQVKELLAPFEHENIIIGGDLNFYMDPKLDKSDKIINKYDNLIYRNEVKSLINTMSLLDPWRILNPKLRRYTWHARGKASRLDYFLTSEHLLNEISNCKINPGLFSDHSIINFDLSEENIERGRGFWKFNVKLLHDTDYVKNIKKIIKNSSKELGKHTDKGLTWEIVKLKIRSFTVPYCIKKKKERKSFKLYLEKNLILLLEELDNNPNDNIENNYKISKEELETIEKEETNSLIFRSKLSWYEDGEKNSIFFLNLEKKNYQNKLISQLEINNNIINDECSINEELTSFYKNLYSENLNTNDKSYIENSNIFNEIKNNPTLSETQKRYCDNNINEEEILSNLKKLHNNKTPGTDGLPSDFYKFFWSDIKTFLINSIQYAMLNNELSIEQKRGIITLIPKKDKNRLLMKNWRPITLLNTDYKLIAKILSSRLQNVLPNIINSDQSGYLKDRFIGDNIRLLEDLSTYTNLLNIPGIIISIDFEKAFDSVNWNFLFKCLKTFNFGNKFINYIQTMYTNIESTVINNGKTSKYFKLQRGVRQGCPLSAYLFILTIEVLAIKIRDNKNIKGIKIGQDEIKISLLADDITLLLNDNKSINITLSTLNNFHQCAGLKINIDKTFAKYIGKLKDSDYFPHGLSWIKTPIYTLGIHIVESEEDNYILNFKQKINNLKTILNIWKQRNLSIKGKITIINSLALSPLIYISSVTHTPQKAIKEINNLIQNFLWNNSTTKISQTTLIQQINKGGLKLCHYPTKIKALRLTWVKRLTSNATHNWKIIPKLYYKCNNLVVYFNTNHQILNKGIIPPFYKELHILYMKFFKKEPTNIKEIVNQSLWLNNNIKIDNTHIYYKHWENKGINKIGDIIDGYGHFLKINQIYNQYKLKLNYLELLQVQKSIPKLWIQKINNKQISTITITNNLSLNINNTTKPIQNIKCNEIYWHIINHSVYTSTIPDKWNKSLKYLKNYNINWERIYYLSFKTTRETKIQSLQYRILNKTIQCNEWLYNLKIKQSKKCDLCNIDETDSIKHYFIDCYKCKTFWSSLIQWWHYISNNKEKFNDNQIIPLIMLGSPSIITTLKENITNLHALDYILLQAKYYIYTKKSNNNNYFDFYTFLPTLKAKINLEYQVLSNKNQTQKNTKLNIIYDNL